METKETVRERDLAGKAVHREAVDVAERKWFQSDGGMRSEERGSQEGRKEKKLRVKQRKRDCKKGNKTSLCLYTVKTKS